MKVSFIILIAFLAIASCEIVPRFPGVQPIVVAGAPGSDLPLPSATVLPVDFEDKIDIDPFTKLTDPAVSILLSEAVPPAVASAEGFDIDTSIIGGERDIILTAVQGTENALFSAGATSGLFILATPSNGESFLQVQYDGRDGSSDLDTINGLGGIDFTANSAQGFRISARSDLDTEFTVTIYDSNNGVATAFAEVVGGSDLQNYFIEFDLFANTIDFTSINAITFEVEGFQAVDFILDEFASYGLIVTPPPDAANCFTGVVLPCDTDYYRLESFDDVQLGDYLSIEYYAVGENAHPDSTGRFYIVSSQYEDLQTELESNENIVDTLGALPGPNNYQYTCTDDCALEIVWSNLSNSTYYIAVEGTGPGKLVYSVCLAYNTVPVDTLTDRVLQPVFLDQRETIPPNDYVKHYHFYEMDVPESMYREGLYLRVNISRVEPLPGLWIGVMYESLPLKANDTGIIGEVDFDNSGARSDEYIYPGCVDTSNRSDNFPFSHPGNDDERVPCECFTERKLFGSGPAYQLTCEVVVDPCQMQYGKWYVAVELPERTFPSDPRDTTARVNYTISYNIEVPILIEAERNVTYKSFVEPNAYTHFKVNVPTDSVVDGETKLHVHLSNVRNGFVDVYVHQGNGPLDTLAGGREGCSAANQTCHTCDACNVIIERCHFSAGDWYISVAISYDQETEEFSINDVDRLPITYTLRVDWFTDPTPKALIAGEPVSTYIGEAMYDFYVIDVPPTVDTWLFVELYVKAEDTEVAIALLHGELPGGDCYARPDFYCMTGDPLEKVWSTGPPTFLVDEAIQRESCSFMIQTCELQSGPLFISVYGHHTGYVAYGDTTFYQVPAHYTLWADFDVALALKDGVSYSENVFEKQYQHYYIRADRVYQGSWLSVEITNIRHGIPQTLEAYVNYQYLAGDCPCYDHLYNCTQNSPCRSQSDNDLTALPDVDSVRDCCTIVVPASDFRPGVWYIAVLGVNEDLYQYTTPIGYTLTATVHDAPQFNPLLLGQTFHGEVPQWNITNEYTHFRLGAAAIPSNDLIVKVTFVQNCEFMGKHDDSTDAINVYLNKGAPANHYLGGWDYKCQADVTTQSYCTIVVPDCQFDGSDYFIAIKGDYSADFIGRFTIQAFTDEVRDIQLTDGIPYYARVSEGRYKHFFISTTAEEDEYLAIDIYTNQDQDKISAYMNKDARAGSVPCHTHLGSCESESMCGWQILACDMEHGRYYFSVYGHPGQFYDTSVEFTITVSHKPVAIQLFNAEPVTGHIWSAGEVQHYFFELDEVTFGGYLLFSVDNVKHGAVTVYGQKDYLAGRCPCFIYERICTVDSDSGADWCEIRIPTCELETGSYYFSVWVTENTTPDALVFQTPVGFVVEIDLVLPRFVRPTVAVGADANLVEYFQSVSNERYIHYGFNWTAADFDAGYHLIVQVSNVQDGALFVYYNPITPGDSDHDCHAAHICTSGLGAGSQCIWQLPYCLVRPLDDNTQLHYITVEGKTGRLQAQYNILLYKQSPPSVTENNDFTLDTPLNSGFFPVGTELNITHSKFNEPNGWTQFIRLPNVPARSDTGRGQLLELFFYRVQNNVGEPIDFNVYVSPKRPAGAHGCCGDHDTIGSCQAAPCSTTADTTVSINNGEDIFSHVCSFDAVGRGHSSSDPFFGERCTVRVWPCEFNKYCTEETLDWFVSVVPVAPTEPSSSGVGLSYSFQWRERNIRNSRTILGESVVLNEFINTYEYTNEYTINSTSTESQGWLSFYVDFYEARTRFSIQTEFTQGTGTVYINGDEFAADTDDCHMYECSSSDDCTGLDRFQLTECQTQYYNRFYITVRNTGEVGSQLGVRFRLVAVEFPAAIEIPSHPSQNAPFVAQSRPSINGIPGVEGSNYDFYYLIIDDDDLDNHNSWVIDIERPVGDDLGELEVFIRYGAEPGHYYSDEITDQVEGCGTWQYYCSLPEVSDRCTFQIPHCQLIEGYHYIAIHNPAFTFAETALDLPEYTLRTYISNEPAPILLNQQVVSRVQSTVGLLQHFSVNITAADIDFDPRESLTGFWTRYLRIQLDGITGIVHLYVNYDALAGPNDVEHSCLYNFDSEICGSGSCFIDIEPCGSAFDQRLQTGVYYIAVEQVEPSSFSLLARVYRNNYLTIPITETIAGVGHRAGTTDVLYRYTVTETELEALGDGDGNYRYTIAEPEQSTDDLDDHEYIVFNFTASPLAGVSDSLNIEVWRDDCSRYSCALSGPDSWCTIDALGLSPATAKTGRFFIRVENPAAMPFTIYYYHNQTTVQNILDKQTITEMVYPYEYQEYYYEASNVGEGATLTVQICSICGDVQAFIRPDLPAGPNDIDHPETIASIDSCVAGGPVDTTFVQDNNCCTLFLDTCQYEQRGYYIGIRGVNTVYPGTANSHLRLPAKYTIKPSQTTVTVTPISFSECAKTIEYTRPWTSSPVQYAFDLESINVGSELRVSLRVPDIYTNTDGATVKLSANSTVGYSDSCPLYKTNFIERENGYFTCVTENSVCSFIVYYCDLALYDSARYYLWVDAPRGSEVIVERFDPYIPTILPNVEYSATINGPDSGTWNLPFRPAIQFYRFELDPKQDEDYYKTFYLNVQFRNINNGKIAAYLAAGHYPYIPSFLDVDGDSNSCLHTYTSPGIVDDYPCRLADSSCDLRLDYRAIAVDKPTTFWVTIAGVEQTCELHSIQYSFTAKSNWEVTYFPIDDTICDSVAEGEYNFHKLQPRQVENPQQSILRFSITDVSGDLTLLLNEGAIAAYPDSNIVQDVTPDSEGNINFDYLCGYNDLYFSIYGFEDSTYKLSITKEQVPVKEVYDDSIYYADDDDDDACPHEHDFYVFRTERGHQEGSFLRVLVDSEFPTTVYVNKKTFASSYCFNELGENDPAESGTTSLNVYDFNFEDDLYYITVVSDGPYYIYTDVRDDAVNLTLGAVYRDGLEPAEYQVYTLEICKDWFEADDRLVVEITDVEGGDVYGWISYGSNPIPDAPASYQDSATALFQPGQSGYDFLLINHCILQAGTYHILIRTSPHEGSPSANLNKYVKYRLFPYLIDFNIEPMEIVPNTIITDVVDFYTLNRINAGSVKNANYYKYAPLSASEGFIQGITQAVVRLMNVQGGLLSLQFAADHLAISNDAFIDGEVYGLTKSNDNNNNDDDDYYYYYNGFGDESQTSFYYYGSQDYPGLRDNEWRMQSSRYPFTKQNVVASNPFKECSGCADLCIVMNINEIDYQGNDVSVFNRDTSAALWVPSCYSATNFYISVQPIRQFNQDHSVHYDLLVNQISDYTLIQPDTNKVATFESNNWDYDFYYSISAEPESMRWRVVVTEGEGVLVTLRNHRCPKQATWIKEVWCDAAYYDRPWMCDIEIPTRAAHPGNNAYFLAVYGKNATYSIAFWRGRENCHEFTGAGRNEGLDFCAGLVPYATWRWDNYRNLDSEAECFFNELFEHFKVQPCWSGVSLECNATLQAFACYESFKRCDERGFYVGTCRDSCNAVVYECANWFETVDLEHYNCSSSRYIDSNAGVCTGSSDFSSFNAGTQHFLVEDPELILFKSSPADSASSASGLTVSAVLSVIALVLALVL